MGLKQILLNFSWDTLINLPPSDVLALLVFFGAWVAASVFLVRLVTPTSGAVPPNSELMQDSPEASKAKGCQDPAAH